jgi:hypothetical protein
MPRPDRHSDLALVKSELRSGNKLRKNGNEEGIAWRDAFSRGYVPLFSE